MSKVIDLTGLSRAIAKIKAWVNGILDWNASEGQDGHIKNRTHYKNDIAICCNETIDYSTPYTHTLKVLAPIIINWEDPEGEYETVLNESNNYTAVVDGYDCTLDASVDKDTLTLTVKETFGAGSIQLLYITQREIKELDEQYIPSTIARQSEITRLESRIAELENAINQITIKVEE